MTDQQPPPRVFRDRLIEARDAHRKAREDASLADLQRDPVYCFYRDGRTGNIWGDKCEGSGPGAFPGRLVDVLRTVFGGRREVTK